MNSYLRHCLIATIFFGAVFLIYADTLDAPFVFDDLNNILGNPHIRLNRLALSDLRQAGFESPLPTRPVANISFALNYFFHRYDVFGYRLINILIHVATGISLFYLFRLTLAVCPLFSDRHLQRWISFFAALIWLVHPIQTQSVTYVVQRMNSLAALFYVLTLLMYARARVQTSIPAKRMLYACCLFTALLALGTKETAATLPAFIFLYEWYFFQDLDLTWLKRHAGHLTAVLMIILCLAFLYLGGHPLERILNSYASRDFSPGQRVFTQLRVVVLYVSLLLLPHPSRLNLDHDVPVSLSLVDPANTMVSMLLIAGLFGLGVVSAKRHRLFSFCIFWFLGNLIIESSILGLEMVFEHRLYLPSMFVSLLAVLMMYRLIQQRWLNIEILCVIVVVFSAWTYGRNSVWKNDISLWTDCTMKSPGKARPFIGLGSALMNREDYRGAVSNFRRALKIDPENALAHNNLGFVLAKQGRYPDAALHFDAALRIKPDYVDAFNNYGNVLLIQNSVEDAVSFYKKALEINPASAETHNNLGVALEKQGKHRIALDHFTRALAINPDHADARRNIETIRRQRN